MQSQWYCCHESCDLWAKARSINTQFLRQHFGIVIGDQNKVTRNWGGDTRVVASDNVDTGKDKNDIFCCHRDKHWVDLTSNPMISDLWSLYRSIWLVLVLPGGSTFNHPWFHIMPEQKVEAFMVYFESVQYHSLILESHWRKTCGIM